MKSPWCGELINCNAIPPIFYKSADCIFKILYKSMFRKEALRWHKANSVNVTIYCCNGVMTETKNWSTFAELVKLHSQ
jgi:hypothetical protein